MVSLEQPLMHKEYKSWKKAVRSSVVSTPLILEARGQKDEDNCHRPLWPIQDLSPQHHNSTAEASFNLGQHQWWTEL